MFGNKSYELPICPEYTSHWGLQEALREIIQNAIDSNSPFVWGIDKEDDGTMTLMVNSCQSTLPVDSLLLGRTTKSNDSSKIGSFGEGYKIALLVLTRLGYDVKVYNDKVIWVPYFDLSKIFGAEVLKIDEMENPFKPNGISFVVSGLNQDEVNEVVSRCLHMQEPSSIQSISGGHYGDILLDRPGKIFVNGLYVCDVDTKYGYNVKPEHLPLERDRQTVSNFELKWLLKNMWFATGDYKQIARLIDEGCPDLEYAHHGTPDLVKEACYRLFREKHPGAIIAGSQKEVDDLVRKDMTNVVIHTVGTFVDIVRSDRRYMQETYVKTKTPEEFLKEFFNDYRGEMRTKAIIAFKTLMKESEKWRLK